MRVLIVDDNEALLQTLGLLIELFGHDVRTCNSPVEATDIATAFQPEVALLDIGMPHLNGYDLCRRLRNTPCLAGLKIIAQSGYGDAESKRKAAEAGFDLHLLKPVASDDLQRILLELEIELSLKAQRKTVVRE